MDTDKYNSITEKVIGCAYHVHNTLGSGFLEKVYENALAHSLRKAGFKVQQQVRFVVRFEEIVAGDYFADLVVDDSILVELKAIEAFETIHSAICINYCAAADLPLCLLINFGKRVEVKRLLNPKHFPSSHLSVSICAPSLP